MGIVGVTQDKHGAPIIRQAVTHKLAIGLGPGVEGNTSNAPKKLDHIAFLKKNMDGKWVKDSELSDHYRKQSGGNPHSLKIVLFDNDLEKVFPSSMKAYKARGCWCKGDGEKAERRDLGKDGKAWGPFKPFDGPCANGGCPLPGNKQCKPVGTLYFSLVDFLKLGSVCKVQTTSWQSVAQIHGALATLQRMTGGILMGIPIKLFMQPDRASYMQNGEAKTGSKFVWGLEVAANDLQEMRRQLTDGPRAFHEIRQLAAGTVIEAEEEDEEDVAEEVIAEFDYDAGDKEPAAEPEHPADSQADIDRIHELLTAMGKNQAQRDAEIGKHKGKIAEYRSQVEELYQKRQKGSEANAKPQPDATHESNARPSGKAGQKAARPQQESTKAAQSKTTPAPEVKQDPMEMPEDEASFRNGPPPKQSDLGFDF
jgi:hypothetical protein